MGQLSHDPTIRHFSHPHPLELANQQGRGHPHNPLLPQPLCSGCTLPPHGYMYACKTCNYSFTLHASCAQLPSHITHPSHPKHHLTLLHSPPYAGGSFNCDACGKRGTAFCYQCSECDFDIHTTCASKPLSVPHRLHHYHHLNLEFFPPYQPQRFSCDICGNAGSNHWLYRCASCEFDAHLDCATAAVNAGTSGQSSLPSPQPQLRPQQQPQHLQHQLSYPGPYPPPQHHQQHQLHHQNSVPAVVMHYQSNYQNVPRPPPPVSPVYGQQPYLQPQPQQPRPPVLPVYLQQQPPPPAAPVYGQQQPQQQQQQQGIMDTMVQNFVGGAAQQAGQMAVENLMGGGGANASNANDPTATDPSSGGDGGNGDSSVIGSVFGSMFGGSVE